MKSYPTLRLLHKSWYNPSGPEVLPNSQPTNKKNWSPVLFKHSSLTVCSDAISCGLYINADFFEPIEVCMLAYRTVGTLAPLQRLVVKGFFVPFQSFSLLRTSSIK